MSATTGGGGIGGPVGRFLARFNTPLAALIGGGIGGAVGLALGSLPGAAIGAAAGAALGAAALRLGPTVPDGRPFGDWYISLTPKQQNDARRFFDAVAAQDAARTG